MKNLFYKKGQVAFSISDLSSIGITLVVLAIILGVGATILSSIQTAQDASVNLSDPGTWNAAYNASGYGLSGLSTLSSYVPTIALVAVAAVVVGIVLTFFGRNQQN